jgi:hypothetical protein
LQADLCFASTWANAATLALRHRERDRRAAHHVESHARDRGRQLRDGLTRAVERRGIRHLEEAHGERRLGADDAYQRAHVGVFFREQAPHAQRHVRERRQVDPAARQLLGDGGHEGESLRIRGRLEGGVGRC